MCHMYYCSDWNVTWNSYRDKPKTLLTDLTSAITNSTMSLIPLHTTVTVFIERAYFPFKIDTTLQMVDRHIGTYLKARLTTQRTHTRSWRVSIKFEMFKDFRASDYGTNEVGIFWSLYLLIRLNPKMYYAYDKNLISLLTSEWTAPSMKLMPEKSSPTDDEYDYDLCCCSQQWGYYFICLQRAMCISAIAHSNNKYML
jgi:hypothetical protein